MCSSSIVYIVVLSVCLVGLQLLPESPEAQGHVTCGVFSAGICFLPSQHYGTNISSSDLLAHKPDGKWELMYFHSIISAACAPKGKSHTVSVSTDVGVEESGLPAPLSPPPV
ncbi:hypothetical protein XELAEV_18036969mg [Xenopus laevis]|uniref:Uncharacterized protein n=1 Tax=Xenopus laevis TaxID=8355 RepID=A0A974CBN8_XENLA|nr:hypothetical protein XELAEV_18036969mg [Xenopus laevis]